MKWTLRFDSKAAKQFMKLGATAQKIIQRYLENHVLKAPDPRTLGKPLMHDKKGIWRYRVDKYRILCRLDNGNLIILVLEVGKRDKIYD